MFYTITVAIGLCGRQVACAPCVLSALRSVVIKTRFLLMILLLLLLLPFLWRQGDVFLWIEVLSAVGTPRLKDFNTKVADAWLAIKLKVSEGAIICIYNSSGRLDGMSRK